MGITDIIRTIHIKGRVDIIRNRRRGKRQKEQKRQKVEEGGGTAFFLFLLTLFFAPLAFGTTETWSMITVELLIALTGLFYFCSHSLGKPVYYRVPGFLPLLLLLGWMVFQVLPLPLPVVRVISPNIFQAYQPCLDLPGLSSFDNWIPLTVNRKATLLEVLRVSSYALFYLVTVQLLTSSRRLLITVKAISGLALCIAFLSILQRITAPDTLFWFRKLTDGKTAFGPWVYKNHYAGFMVILCPLVLSQFLLHRSPSERVETLREKVLTFFSENEAPAHLFWGFGSIVILSSIFLTQSRGGILSIICGVLLFFLFIARHQEKLEKLPLLFLMTGLLIIVGWYSWEPLLERFSFIFDSETGGIRDDRLLIWKDALKIIAAFPLTGSGFGTFVDIFPGYKTLPDDLLYEHAHNDFLELLTDGGLIAGGLGLWFIMSVLRAGYRQILLRKDSVSVFLAIGVFSGLAGLLVYSIFDFNLHNGANGLYFAFFCGLLVSAGNTRRYYQASSTLLVPITSSWRMRGTAFVALLVFLCATLFFQGRIALAERYYQQARMVASLSNLRSIAKREKMIGLLKEANTTDPLTGLYAYALANLRRLQKKNEEAIFLSSEAVLRQPMNFFYLQQLGHLMTLVDPSGAQQLLETGYRRADQKTLSFQTWAKFELSRHSRGKGLERLKKELEQNSRLLRVFYPLLSKYNLDQKEVAAVLPERTSAWIGFWDQMKKESRTEEYTFVLERALDFIDNEPKVYSRYFTEVARYYRTEKKEKKAEDVLRLGIRHLPSHVPFHIFLGEIYLKREDKDKAIKEYEQALLLDPKNEGLQHRVGKLQQKR
ncbi:MAG: tetratricopeptide repeat protein [Candidatus Electrothrix sp. GM3_4]|nr:tetratricopeptide repeat protein [Candidatus Electrothrix sp. GM3_4]